MAKSGTNLGPVGLSSDVPSPWGRHLMAKSATKLGTVDLSSDIPSEASSGQEWY